jgi:hypothetical protein
MKRRNRLHYAMFTGVVIIAGCASRSALSESWAPFLVDYAGDTLWALMVFLGVGFLLPAASTVLVASAVLMFSFGVEFSQLYHAGWIDSFRNTFVGAVTLGSGFLWSDFACYTIGCGIGVIGELTATIVHKKKSTSKTRALTNAAKGDHEDEEG